MLGDGLGAYVNTATELITEALPEVDSGVLVQFVLAALVFVVGWYLSKLVVRLAGRTVAQRIERPSVTRSVLRFIRLSVLAVTVVVIARIMDVGNTQILVSVTVISAVIAVVLAPLVGSLINGFFVIADRPFEIGDMIEVTDEQHRGFVEDITIRYTKIFTLDNTVIVIPNSVIHERDVVNYSAEDERTRQTIRFEITYESDLAVARQSAERAARNVDQVIAGGPDIRIGSSRYAASPRCFVESYAASGIQLALRFWVDHPYQLLRVRSIVQEQIWDRYADADVEIAYPHRHHIFDETSGIARVTGGDRSDTDSPEAVADTRSEPTGGDEFSE